MKITFLGASSWAPESEQADTASLLVDGHILVDTGWNVIRNLLREGVNPRDITSLCFTHMHQDHYISLAAYLFYLLNGFHSFENLTIYGPEGVNDVTAEALTYCGFYRHHAGKNRESVTVAPPKVRQLKPEDQIAESGVRISCIPNRHAVPGRAYRFEDAQSRASCAYSGDTAAFPELAAFAAGSDVLIHEASFGDRPAPSENPYGHSSAMDAAEAARAAGVKQLYMVHMPASARDAAEAAARRIFPNTRAPKERESFTL